MKILLLGNYVLDRQESMQRFAEMFERSLQAKGHTVRIIRPQAVFGRCRIFSAFVAKWLGYLDKLVIFPHIVTREARWAEIVHICDHSNAVYVRYLRKVPHLVTCHDVLAIRGSLGEQTDCPASLTGKILQQWIFGGLRRAKMVVCISVSTRNDLLRLLGEADSGRIQLILYTLNYPYGILEEAEAKQRLIAQGGFTSQKPYLLHVGSNLKRKNRAGVLRIFQKIKDTWEGNLVFAGEPLDREWSNLSPNWGCRIACFRLGK